MTVESRKVVSGEARCAGVERGPELRDGAELWRPRSLSETRNARSMLARDGRSPGRAVPAPPATPRLVAC